ncbi:hypothetical protein ACFLTH_15185 [Bacteroidota bacterium]
MRDKNIFEWAFIIILLLGIISAFILDSLFLQMVTIFIFGMMASTIQQMKKTDLNFAYVILIIGFIIGYLIATKSGHRFVILLVFGVGIFTGVFAKNWLRKKLKTII